jgi:hypothetical protein
VGVIKLSYAFARASAWTFQIPPVKALVTKYVGDGKGWVDPFAGSSVLAEFRNDMNTSRNTPWHMEAQKFCQEILPTLPTDGFKGILFDPPYSYRQVSEHYKLCGSKASSMDTSANFVARVKNAANPHMPAGAIAITCGWNTVGFGKSRGWEKVEILVVEHGSSHNNTLVTVERKIQNELL